MLEGKAEKIEFQKMLSSPHRKNKMSKNKTKMLKKRELRELENKKKWWKMRDEWKDNEKWSFMKWSLVWSPWNTIWAYYLFFRNHEPWPVLRTWKVHFDQMWILGLKSFLPWEIFHNQQGCCLFSSAKILDKPFTCSGWIFKCIIGQSKQKKKWKKKKWL